MSDKNNLISGEAQRLAKLNIYIVYKHKSPFIHSHNNGRQTFKAFSRNTGNQNIDYLEDWLMKTWYYKLRNELYAATIYDNQTGAIYKILKAKGVELINIKNEKKNN